MNKRSGSQIIGFIFIFIFICTFITLLFQARILPACSGSVGDEELLALCDLKVAKKLLPNNQEIARTYIALSGAIEEFRKKEKEYYTSNKKEKIVRRGAGEELKKKEKDVREIKEEDINKLKNLKNKKIKSPGTSRKNSGDKKLEKNLLTESKVQDPSFEVNFLIIIAFFFFLEFNLL